MNGLGKGASPSHPFASSTVQGHAHLDSHLTADDEENPDHHLEEEGDADEHDEGDVVLEGSPLLQHCLELGDVRHEQRHVQHALRHALLRRVVVDVHRAAHPEVRIRALGRREKPHELVRFLSQQDPLFCLVMGFI